jgi:hypothetical protein
LPAHGFAKIAVRFCCRSDSVYQIPESFDLNVRPRFAMERSMAMRIHATVSAAVLFFPSILMALDPTGSAAAQNVCLEQPDREAPPGEHWHYHYDRQKNRRCWHLGAVAPATAAPAPRPRAQSFSLNTVFAPLVRGLRNLFRQPMPHEAAAGEPRIVQSDATRPLTIDDIARRPEFPEERAETRPVLSLTAVQRKALYDEYLKWEALERSPTRAPVPAR